MKVKYMKEINTVKNDKMPSGDIVPKKREKSGLISKKTEKQLSSSSKTGSSKSIKTAASAPISSVEKNIIKKKNKISDKTIETEFNIKSDKKKKNKNILSLISSAKTIKNSPNLSPQLNINKLKNLLMNKSNNKTLKTMKKNLLASTKCESHELMDAINKAENLTNKSKNPNFGTNLQKRSLKVIPLGGLCEVGRNMTAIEYKDDMIIVDAGVSFPDESQPGVDKVIPNMNYIFENRHKLRGVFITHGHEDHIGSIVYLCQKLNCKIYAAALTLALINLKLEESRLLRNAEFYCVKAGDKIKAGCFSVEFIHVNHSIADSFALAVDCPLGTILHTGDFKIDYTPINGGPIDLPRLATLGAKGVLLMLCESTNVEKAGFSMSESKVGQCFIDEFAKANGRIIVATFASNIHRIQQIITAAEKNNRKVAIVGRSMNNVFKAANKLKYIKAQPDTVVDIDKISSFPENKTVIITTGSQGEPMAALTRMAFSDHRTIEINERDTVIISSTPIPGNEKSIYRVINELYKKHCKVVYSAMAEVHVSGHAYREEIKLMHQLVRPKYFMPVHGEYRMLYEHAVLAHEMGQSWESIFVMNNGDILQITDKKAEIADFFSCDPVLIDGKSQTSIDNTILEERLYLGANGLINIALAVNNRENEIIGNISINYSGFNHNNNEDDMNYSLNLFIEKLIAKSDLSKQTLSDFIKSNKFKDKIKDFVFNKSGNRPLIIISLINY